MAKRTTPPDDVERLAERLHSEYGREITDEDTFNNAFNDYMEELTDKQDKELRDKTFKAFKKKFGIEERARAPAPAPAPAPVMPPVIAEKEAKEYKYIGKSGVKVVYARQDKIKVKGKEQVIYRDRKGHYVSVKRVKEKMNIKLVSKEEQRIRREMSAKEIDKLIERLEAIKPKARRRRAK
jgi:hypothetical protein